MSLPEIDGVTFDDDGERLKVIFPVRRNPLFLTIYSLLMVVWIGISGWMVYLFFAADISSMRLTFVVVWFIILIVWAYIWYRLGRNVWHWWQYYMANREVLLLDEELLVVHRPFFLTGATDAYALEHVSPFFYEEEKGAIGFAYGSRAGTFASGLSPARARRVAGWLNRRYFPDAIEE